MLTYVYLFLGNLLFSCVVEAGLVGMLVHATKMANAARVTVVAIVGTALTIPYVWFVFPTLLYSSPTAIILVGEMFAFTVEGLLYAYFCNLPLRVALLLSFIANLASYGLGQLVW